MASILCTGAASWDIVLQIAAFPAHPTKVLASNCVETCAGMATAAAMTIASLGGSASILARLGTDETAARWLSDVQAAGVSTSLVEQVAGARSGLSTIVVDGQGERLIVPFYDQALRREPPRFNADQLAPFDAFLVDTRWPQAAERVLEFARTNGRPALLDADIADIGILQSLVPLASQVIFSSEALALLCPGGSAADQLQKAHVLSNGLVGVTLGAEGCLLHTGADIAHVRAPAVKVVDTLAAGDVFHGAFILAHTEGMTPVQAATFANAAAALKCTRFGGIAGRPTRADVEHLLAD